MVNAFPGLVICPEIKWYVAIDRLVICFYNRFLKIISFHLKNGKYQNYLKTEKY